MKSKYQGARAQTKQTLSSDKIMVMEEEKKKTLIILLLLFIAGTSSCSDDVKFCVFDDEDPSSVQQRLEQKLRASDVVLAGYTRHEYSREAEFLVLNVFKGEQKVAGLFQNRKLSALESALNRRLVNVTGFLTDAEPRPECKHGIRIGETYLLFAKFASKLILNGADAIQTYSKGKEEEVKKLMQIIGATKSTDGDQSEWSTCSKSCGGGIQVKRSSCTGRSQENCSPPVSGLQRSCNTFPCIGLTDVLEIVGLRQSPRHQEDRPAAYRIASNSSWNSTASFPAGGFPAQFSLMIAIRSEKEPAPGFLFRLLQNGRHMQVAVHLSKDTVSLILPDGLYVRFKQENKLKHGSWQWMSFSIRRNTVTFFLDCKPSGVLPATIAEDSRKLTGLAEYVVGSIGNKDRSFFRGEVEQILFSEAPSAAAEQCSVLEQPLERVSSMSPSEIFDVDVDKRVGFPKKTAGIAASISTKQDDEDFDFNNDDDGSGSFYDDEYDDEEEKQGTDIKKAVLLLSESPDKDDDEDIDENNDLNNFLHNKIRDDVDQEEEDYDDDEDEEETGSGFASSTKALPEWTDWSECSRTCDWGVRSRTLITSCTTSDDDDDTCTTAQPQQQQSESCFKATCPPPTTTAKPKVTRKKVTRKDYSSKPLPSWRSSWAKIGGSQATATTRTGTEYQRFYNKHQTLKKDSANCKPICQNGGTCSTFGSRCICKKGFFGRYCEKAACDGLCENGGICAQHGRCLCLPGFYGIRCEFRKCNLVAVKRPYEKSFKKKIVKEEKFPCGAWGWKKCSRKKVYYAPVFQTFYRTEYVCDKENFVPSEEAHRTI